MNNDTGALGKIFADGEVIIRQGDIGNEMYVIQEGQVNIILENPDGDYVLGTLDPGAFFGEMAIFDRERRSATVKAKGQARILTIDKRNFMQRIHSDPALAFRLVEMMSQRIRDLDKRIREMDAKIRNALSG